MTTTGGRCTSSSRGAVVVLILSTVNVATLLLGRAVRRSREFALRGALGGSVRSLARQLLVEGALITVPGAALGMLVTMWTLRLLGANLPEDLLLHGSSVPVDLRVASVALALTAATTIAFALVPMFTARRIDAHVSAGGGSRTGASTREGRTRRVLLTVQIALTVLLLSGAGLFLKSFVALTRVPLGFDPVNAMAVRATLSGPRYATDDQLRQYAGQLIANISAAPGVRDAAVASSSPLGSGPMIRFTVSGRPKPVFGDAPRAIVRAVTPSYFRTLATRVVKGREFSDADVAGAPSVAIVNENLVKQVFPGEDPIGRAIEVFPGSRPPWTNRPGEAVIVGVASNIKEVGINEIDFADVYFPFAQMPAPALELIARTNVPPASVLPSIRQRAASVDPAIPVTSTTTLDARVSLALQGDRFNLLLTVSFAGRGAPGGDRHLRRRCVRDAGAHARVRRAARVRCPSVCSGRLGTLASRAHRHRRRRHRVGDHVRGRSRARRRAVSRARLAQWAAVRCDDDRSRDARWCLCWRAGRRASRGRHSCAARRSR